MLFPGGRGEGGGSKCVCTCFLWRDGGYYNPSDVFIYKTGDAIGRLIQHGFHFVNQRTSD